MTKAQEKSESSGVHRPLYTILSIIAAFAIASLTILFFLQTPHDNIISNKHSLRSKPLVKEKSSSKTYQTAKNIDPFDQWLEETHRYYKFKRDYYRLMLDNLEKEQPITSNLSPIPLDLSQTNVNHTIDPTLSDTGSRKLHAVTYASHSGRDDRFCRAIESAIRNKIDIIILGWNTPWKGLSQKLEAAMKYAKSLPVDDVILFTDAFDVLYTQSSTTIWNRFQEFNSSLIFSAECGCWPHVAEDPAICLKKYPPSPTPYRYLNSGTWIGYSGSAWRMLDEVIKEAGQDFTNANDQKLIADLYINGRFGIQLDYFTKLFQSMHLTMDPPLPYCSPAEDLVSPKDRQPGSSWYNKKTKSPPAVFHFNGGGKRYHLDMESKMWYKDKKYNTAKELERLKSHLVSIPNEDAQRRIRFDQLCPDYLDSEYK
jgi:hypothetical protein